MGYGRFGNKHQHDSKVCGSKEGEFFPSKCKKSGKSIAQCIKCNGRWMNPIEFESLGGKQGKKWRENIKFDDKPLGHWLAEHEIDPVSQKLRSKEKPPRTEKIQLFTQQQDNDGSLPLSSAGLLSPITVTCLTREPTIATSDNQQECGPQAPETSELPRDLEQLEQKMSASIRTDVKEAIDTFKASILAEIHSLHTTIVSLTSKVVQLEKELTSLSTTHMDLDNGNQLSLENRPPLQVKPLYASCVKTVDQEELLQLQSQVQSLTTQQRKMTEEKEREKRKCNLLLGNLEESESESSAITTQKVKDVFDNNMKIHTTPQYVTRIGKATAGRNRLILIKMNSFEEKLQLLKRALSLSGTGLFLMETCQRRKKRKEEFL